MVNRHLPAMDATRCKKGRRLSFAKLTVGVFLAVSPVSLHGSDGKDLMEAAYAGDAPLVNSLLEKGPDINYQGKNGATPLFMASQQGHEAVVQALLAKNAETDLQNDDGETPLIIASQHGHEAVVQALLANGADIEHEANKGATAMIAASIVGHHEIVKALLANGAEADHQSIDGFTALSYASHRGHHEIVNTLLANGAEADHQAMDGFTALIYASKGGHHEIVNTLLANGADIEQETNKGVTALMVASFGGHHEIVKTLLANGAEADHQSKKGFTALIFASNGGHHEIVNTLLANGAEAGQVLTNISRAVTALAWSLFGDGKGTTKLYAGKSQPDAGLSQILVLPGLSITAIDGNSVKSKHGWIGYSAYKQLPGTYEFEVTSWKRRLKDHYIKQRDKHAAYALQVVLEAGQKYELSPIWNDSEVGIILPSQVCLEGQSDVARVCALRPRESDEVFAMDETHGVIVVGLTRRPLIEKIIMINLDCEWKSTDPLPRLNSRKPATKTRDVCYLAFEPEDSKGYIVESVDAGVWKWWGLQDIVTSKRLITTMTFDVEAGKVNYIGHVAGTHNDRGKLLGFGVTDHYSLLEPIIRAGFGDSEIVNKATNY